jgi:hypothetical protein
MDILAYESVCCKRRQRSTCSTYRARPSVRQVGWEGLLASLADLIYIFLLMEHSVVICLLLIYIDTLYCMNGFRVFRVDLPWRGLLFDCRNYML